jgi:hypothetical protein
VQRQRLRKIFKNINVGTVKEGKAYKKIEAYGKVVEVRKRGKFLCMKKCNIKNTGKSRAKCVGGGRGILQRETLDGVERFIL